MRILLIGHRNPWRMEAAVERAFRRAGHETLLFDDRRSKRLTGWRVTQWRALRAARRFRPDFVFLSKCLALAPDTVQEIMDGGAIPNAMWYHDPQWHRDTDRPDIGHIAAIGKLSRVFFVTGFDAEWRALGLPAKFLPAAGASEIVPVPHDPRFAAEVAFIGTPYDEQRPLFLAEVARHVPLRVWGPGWRPWRGQIRWGGRAVEGRDFAAVCSSSKIVLGVNPARAQGATTYASDRMWMVILAGAFYLGARTPGVDRLLLDGVHCAWYADVGDCAARARHFLAEPRERERIRAEGERFVRAHHTYDRRIANLLSGAAWTSPL
jgi:hypothetical protein